MASSDGKLNLFAEPAEQESLIAKTQVGPWADMLGENLFAHAIENGVSIPTLSLFSGAGGLDIGFHDVGFDIQHAVEIEEVFAKTLSANVGEGSYFGQSTTVHCTDIKDFVPEGLKVDFIIGGPPCQSFSAAGARAMGVAGTRDDRGNLFAEYVRILKDLQPKGFLFENVYRLLGANGGDDWKLISGAFSNAGYVLHHKVLDTADYGVPQHRERLIVVGVRKDIAKDLTYYFPRPTHGPDSRTGIPHFTAGSALSDKPLQWSDGGIGGSYGSLLVEIPPGLNYSYFTEKMGHPNPIFAWRSKFSDFLYKADPTAPVRTIKAQGGQYTGPFHWGNRPFSEDELKRLQSFPDKYKIVGKRQKVIHQIGNSVPPQFARMLAVSVLEQIFQTPSAYPLDYSSGNLPPSFRQKKRRRTDVYRAAAAKSILNVKPNGLKGIFDHRFGLSIGEKFSVCVTDTGDYTVSSYFRENRWDICLSCSRTNEAKSAMDFELAPVGGWIIPASKICISHSGSKRNDYLAAWKALDHLLAFYGLKADLVQLFGYYQYPSGVICTKSHIEFTDAETAFSTFVRNLLGGRMVAKPYKIEDFSTAFGISEQSVLKILRGLKTLGYEVRSSNTNQAIDADIFMLPYSFPTLTPQSVQLNKGL